MVDSGIDEGQAKAQIEVCETEIKALNSEGAKNVEANSALKLARSFFRLGEFEKAFLFAVRARRLAIELKTRKR